MIATENPCITASSHFSHVQAPTHTSPLQSLISWLESQMWPPFSEMERPAKSLTAIPKSLTDCQRLLGAELGRARAQTDKKTLNTKVMMQEIKEIREKRRSAEDTAKAISVQTPFVFPLNPDLTFNCQDKCAPTPSAPCTS